MSYFNIIAQSSESTVVTEYKPQSKRSEAYQSEADLEKEFIRLLCELGYERLTIHKEADLIANLRTQLEKLNNYRFTDGEWKRFWDEVLANTNSGILEKTRLIQEDYVQVLRRDNGESKNIQLIDKKCIHNNSLQVINQYAISTEEGAAHDNRYDVTVLVNGLPLIHIELKRRGVPIREAFNQIDRYQRDLLGVQRALRVCADFRDLQRHKYEVLFQYHPFQPYQGCQSAESQEVQNQQ